ncbi:uncharacterized protein LOC132698435 [Cylas formicarius]|uniref:uncharacterized protein LOC132698435 n=1 Tax=Cylas formicarius TaxID=197179 RepID=UPI0029584C61|nr:uncharacterized protein LOC132698435 [Cylas formicarius]
METPTECLMCGQHLDKFPSHHSPQAHRQCHRPGIGRPARYSANETPTLGNQAGGWHGDGHGDEDKTFESLIGMTKEQFYAHQSDQKRDGRKKAMSVPKPRFHLSVYSRGPLKCPHKSCRKTVAVAHFVNHFKSEHSDVGICSVERDKELCVPLDISLVEHGLHFCLTMITVYQMNRVDFVKSGSSESVRRACSKFCQNVPVDTFWLMASGSVERKSNVAYCFFWLLTNSEGSYKCSMELSSKDDSVCLSTYCAVTNFGNGDFSRAAKELRALLVTRSSLKFILKEGAPLNLRVTVH